MRGVHFLQFSLKFHPSNNLFFSLKFREQRIPNPFLFGFYFKPIHPLNLFNPLYSLSSRGFCGKIEEIPKNISLNSKENKTEILKENTQENVVRLIPKLNVEENVEKRKILDVSDKSSSEFSQMIQQTNPNVDMMSQKEALEIKDAEIIFNSTWNKLSAKYGKENLKFPKEIIWLMGAPGAGKSYNAPWIRKARGITADEIVISSLLTSEEAQKIKQNAGLVGDSLVVEMLLEKLLQPIYAQGVVVDGFPRTKVQVECIKMLKEKMIQLKQEFLNTSEGLYFRRPVFRVAVLFVDENESVERQLKRGREAQLHNDRVRESGIGVLLEERSTDYSEEKARSRYGVFRDHYSTLQELRKYFPFSVINTKAPVQQVREDITKEFTYQSSLELASQTYDAISRIPVVSEITQHARQNLVRRLDNYETQHPELFHKVIGMIKEEFLGRMRQQSISGEAQIRTKNSIFNQPLALEMVLDVLAERGYHVAYHPIVSEIPVKVDLTTGEITCRTSTVLVFNVRFKRSIIRSEE